MTMEKKNNAAHWDSNNDNGQWKTWKEEVQDHAANRISEADLGPVRIKSLSQLKKLLIGFRESANTMTSKLLIKGFKMISQRAEYKAKAEALSEGEVDFGGFQPAKLPDAVEQATWVDNLVRSQMGGKREGTRIVWDLPEGRFYYDPLTRQLTQADG